MRFLLKKIRGFTLIELLFIVTILGILASIVLATMQQSKVKARNEQRVSDLQQLQLALRLYKDANGEYPPMGCGGTSPQWASPGPGSQNWYISCGVYIGDLIPDYIAELPTDPSMENDLDRGFLYQSNGTDYKIITYLTAYDGTKNIAAGQPFARCPVVITSQNQQAVCGRTYTPPQRTAANVACGAASFSVYSPGAACW